MPSEKTVVHEPPKTFQMKFCPGCGRNDLVQSLNLKHYASGQRCDGTLITVTYLRKD